MSAIFLIVFLVAVVGLIRPFANLRRLHFAAGAFLSFLLIGVFAPNSSEQAGSTPQASLGLKGSSEKADSSERGETDVTRYMGQLRREIASLRENPGLTDIPDDREGVLVSAAVIGARVNIYRDAPRELPPEGQRLRREFRQLAIAYQRDAFPKLRRAQAAVFDRIMWEENIDVAAVGTGNRILRLTGGIFASNRAIATARDSLGDTLQILRFDQDRYEWYRGSEYTYFDRDGLPDSAFANWTGNTWVQVPDEAGSSASRRTSRR